MLEEIQYEYKVTKVNLFKNEQFNPEFKKISPFSKIPVIVDHDNGKTIFASGEEISSVENKMIVFPSNLKHAGTTHTDTKYRLVLNLNYF